MDKTAWIRPQPGRQEEFLSCSADFALYGGAAGGGKTYAALMELARWVDLPTYKGVLFRRTRPQLMTEGGVWDESRSLYPMLGGRANEQKLRWKFPSGAVIGFKQQQHAHKVEAETKGLQADVIEIDQLEDFEAKQLFYLMSRNRGSAPVNSYFRATANPQPGWLADFISWWWHPDTGYPILERAGVKRWFVRLSDVVHWADSAAELVARFPRDVKPKDPKSVTFIPATIYDNPANLAKNPRYESDLKAGRHVEQERLLHGNWLVRDDEGCMWPAEYFVDVYAERWPEPEEFELKIIVCDPVTNHDGTDDAAIVFLGLLKGRLYVDADVARIPASELPDRAMGMAAAYLPEEIGIESDGFAELIAGEFDRYAEREGGLAYPIVPISHHGAKKPVRIQRLGGMLRAGKFRFRRNSPGVERLLMQLRSYGLKRFNDDGPDALEMGLRRMRVLIAEVIEQMEAA